MQKKEKSLIESYYDATVRVKEAEEQKKDLRSELVKLFSKYGEKFKEGSDSKCIYHDDYSVILEKRKKVEVDDENAVKFLKSKSLGDVIKSVITLTLKDGQVIGDVPQEVLESISEYFNIDVEETVPKERLETLVETGELTRTDFNKCVKVKDGTAIKFVEYDD